MDILEEIKNGESKILEFKEKLPRNDSIAKSIIAFSNTAGGKLVIGINDDREIIGIEDDIFDLQDKISSIIYDNCYPNILPEMYVRNIKGKNILIIKVSRGGLLPYYLKKDGKNKGTYIRVGATNRIAEFENIVELERQRRNISFDEEIDYEEEYSKLNLKPIYEEFEKLGRPINEEKMINLKLLKEENGGLYPTRGLLILLGIYENVEVKCSRFKGNTMSVFLDKKEYRGDLFSQLKNVESFIKNHINLKGEIKGLQRIDTFEIPEVAIREAIINALVHRDYSNFGRDVKIGIYDDRLEIISPGSLPSGLSNADLTSGRSEVRNRIIARLFKELGYIEQWGSGISRIKDTCKEAELKEPIIEESGDFVGVRIFRKLAGLSATGHDGSATGHDGLTLDQEKVLEYIKEYNMVKTKNIKELLSVKDTKAKNILKEMIDKNLIERVGNGSATHYILKKRQ